MSSTGRRPFVNPALAGFVAGLLIALLVGFMALINVQYGAPWARTHTLTAQVVDADSMSVGSDVRIAGRLVGQVVAVQAAGDHTNITFHVDDADWPLAGDTTASVRLATLLGQKYLQLNPGASTQTLADNAVLGVQRTKPVVDFDQILDTFDKPTRDALTRLVRTASAAVAGQEGTLQQLIPALATLSETSQVPTQELVSRNPEINRILINLGVVSSQLDASSASLAGFIDHLNMVTAALASNQGHALTSFITSTNRLNVTTNAVLGNGGAAQLGAGLRQLGTFSNELNTLLGALIPQTTSFTRPVPGAEPSDFINGNDAIPAKSAIDLIYEITEASSQGYGFQNFGGGGASNVQGNFFLRQNAAGFDDCAFKVPVCQWGQRGPAPAPTAAAAPAATPTPAPPAPPTFTSPGNRTPSPSASAAPAPTPTGPTMLTPPPFTIELAVIVAVVRGADGERAAVHRAR